MNVIDHRVTGVTVLSEEIGRARIPSGARVTVEFSVPAPIPTNCEVAVAYDLADDGRWRECRGIPAYTHCTLDRSGSGTMHHYRLSQWIAPALVMHFARVDGLHDLNCRRRSGPKGLGQQ